jgi:hypothetical protein
MATIYSSDLKLSIMATGENAGTWGQITNTNLYLLQQAIGGYQEVSIAGGAQTTALAMSDGALSNARNAVIKLTGTITGNQIVTVPTGVEKTWIVYNGTTGAFTVEFKQAGGTGVTFTSTNKGFKYLYADATNVNEISLASPPGGSDTQVQFNSGGTAFGGSANFTWDGTNLLLDSEGALRLGDNTGSAYVGLKAPATITSDAAYTLVLPVATGTANQVLSLSDSSGTLTFATVAGGAAWQAVQTSGFTAVAKRGYFCNTTSSAFTATLPVSATIGDFISFIDYAGTFDTNNLTIARNGHNIQGVAEDLTVSVERAGLTLVYVDSTQGWLLQNK